MDNQNIKQENGKFTNTIIYTIILLYEYDIKIRVKTLKLIVSYAKTKFLSNGK